MQIEGGDPKFNGELNFLILKNFSFHYVMFEYFNLALKIKI